MHREDQLTDYRRQDQVAAQAQRVAQAATDAAKSAQRSADEAGLKLDAIGVQTQRIHTLVNSDMTAARQEELDQAESLIVALRRVIQVSRDKGLQPDPSDVSQLERTMMRRDQLESILADRLQQFKVSEAEAAKTEAGREMLSHDKDKDDDGTKAGR
jgi:hypothetical protein